MNVMENLLPYDGTVLDHGIIFTKNDSKTYFQTLLNSVPWQNDQVKVFNKIHILNRKSSWFADHEATYAYSGINRKGLAFIPVLTELRSLVESYTHAKYNSCLLNYYENGSDGMGWHADNESSIQKRSSITSLSFGAERKFVFRHNQSGIKIELRLHDGQLIEMKDETQTHWKHALPKSKKVSGPRINLTFRLTK